MAKPNEMNDCETKTVNDSTQLGICSTCNDIEICVNKRTWKGPVLFCEEFNDYVSSKIVKENSEEISNIKETSLSEKTSTGVERRGLCVNCLLRDTCGFPIVEGGVWHCEEYE